MSGPWDRQPSPEPDDEWPSEDLGRRDRWSTTEPSRDAARDAGPGWDDWPAPPPPADDYLIEEPLAPSSDPWAESWTDEASAGPAPTWSGERADAAGPRVEPWSPDADPWGLPAADVSWQEPIRPTPEAASAPAGDETPAEPPEAALTRLNAADGGLAFGGDVALADTGARGDPFVAGIDDLGQLVVGQALLGQVAAGACDAREHLLGHSYSVR